MECKSFSIIRDMVSFCAADVKRLLTVRTDIFVVRLKVGFLLRIKCTVFECWLVCQLSR